MSETRALSPNRMSIFQSVSLIEIAEESPLKEYELERNHTETFHENDLPTPPEELDQAKDVPSFSLFVYVLYRPISIYSII